jgi:hypothetical protein
VMPDFSLCGREGGKVRTTARPASRSGGWD